MPVSQIVTVAGRGGTAPPTPIGTFFFNGSPFTYGSYGNQANLPLLVNQRGADGTVRADYQFAGTGDYLMTPALGSAPAIEISIWFYPTALNSILITEQDTATENTSYHCSLIEITGTGTVRAGSWSHDSPVTTANTVTLNAWNHVFYYHSGLYQEVTLNGGSAAGAGQTRSAPTFTYLGLGAYTVTNFGVATRFQGHVGYFSVRNSATAVSDYSSTKSYYQAQSLMNFDASDPSSYSGSGNLWYDTESTGGLASAGLVQSPTFNSGSPKSFTFNRNSYQYARVDTAPNLGQWTVEAWFKVDEDLTEASNLRPEGFAVVSTVFDDQLESIHPGYVNYVIGAGMTVGFESLMHVGFFDGSTWHVTNGFAPGHNTWKHVIGTYNGTDLIAYVNGSTHHVVSTGVTSQAGTSPLRIARRWDGNAGDANQYFPGTIGQVRIYSGAMSSGDVLRRYNDSRETYGFYTRYAMVFNGTSSWLDCLGNTSDWALGNTGTIEYWIKPTIPSSQAGGGFLGAVMSQISNNGIDSWIANGVAVSCGSSNYGVYTEPTAGVWTHVACVWNGAGVNGKVYLNGVEQTVTSGQNDSGQFNNSTNTLNIGKRGDGNFQYINARISDIRINTTAVYTANFTPPAGPLTNITGTKLLISGSTIVDQTGRHTFTNNGVTVVADGLY